MRSRMVGLMVILLLSCTPSMLGQSKDLSGTWSGETVVPNSPDKDSVTLILKKAGDSYTGTISDSLGMLNETPLEKVKFENDTLSFAFVVLANGQEIRVHSALKPSADKLVGSWESEDGANGRLEMVRMK